MQVTDPQGTVETVEWVRRDLGVPLLLNLAERGRAVGVGVVEICHLAWALVLERVSASDEVQFGSLPLGAAAGVAETEHSSMSLALPRIVSVRTEGSVAESVRRLRALLHEPEPLAERALQGRTPSVGEAATLGSVLAWRRGKGEAVPNSIRPHSGADEAVLRPYPLAALVEECHDSFALVVRTAAGNAEQVCELMRNALSLLASALASSSQTQLRMLDVLAPDERRKLLVDWNTTRARYPKHKCLHELFEEQAAACPVALAVAHGERTLSYHELNGVASCLATRLRQAGVATGSRVAVLMPRSIELVVAEIAIVKAGATYVPLDPDAPAERLAFMIDDCEAVLLLVGTEQRRLEAIRVPHLPVDLRELTAAAPGSCQSSCMSESAAYVMYTSGSTGQPKGVEVPHRAVNRLLLNNGYARFVATDRVAFVANPAFDPSTLEVWAPLLHGGCIVVVDSATVRSPERLREVLREQRVTVLNLTSAVFNQYADALCGVFAQLRCLLVGGDVVDPRAVARVLQKGSPEQLINTYGPTETTLYATAFQVHDVANGATTLPIGRPIANTSIYILDAKGRPAPIGGIGEVHIGGAGVALGYVRRPELTAASFIPDPFGAEPGARLYKTGDLARWNTAGQVEFIGRRDHQVKIRGFRIELGEIESRLSACPGVAQVAVLAREDVPTEKSLVAYFSPAADAQPEQLTPSALRARLALVLPDYMVPAAYMCLAALPLNANGKVDRRSLPAPAGDVYVRARYEEPKGATERILARSWADLLDVARIGRHDSFFDLGGDSIRAIKLVWKLRREGFQLEPRQVAENPTLARLASCLRRATAATGEQGILSGELLFSVPQQEFFAACPREPHHFNQAQVFELNSRSSLPRLREMFSILEAQHDMLRARYVRSASGWLQSYGAPSKQVPLDELEAPALAAQSVGAWVDEVATEAQRGLNLHNGPLYRARLLRLKERDVLLIVVHHLAIDSVSWRVLADDLNQLLVQERAGQGYQLGPKAWSFRQWLAGLREYAHGPALAVELDSYWMDLCAKPSTDLPFASAGDGIGSSSCVVSSVLSPDEASRLLTQAPRALNAQVNELLLTALGSALASVFGGQRWRIAVEGHGREQELVPGADVSRTVGWFTAVFPFVIDVSGGSLQERLASVRCDWRRVPHKGVGYGLLCQLSRQLPGDARDRLQQLRSNICFNYLGQATRDLSHEELRAAALPSGTWMAAENRSPWPFEVTAQVDGTGSIQAHFRYPGTMSEPMERVASSFRSRLLELGALASGLAGSAAGARPKALRAELLGRAAAPRDYEQVSAICAATFASKSRWVANQLAARTWLDPLWAANDSAKFVLEGSGRVVGYLIGALDLDRFDFRGLRRTCLAAPRLLARAAGLKAVGEIGSDEWNEIVHYLETYAQYSLWHARCRWNSKLGGVPHASNVSFHFNILDEYAASGGMLTLIGMWESWLRSRGERYAYLNASSFHGLEHDPALQSELAEGLGYRCDARLSSVCWVKELGIGESSN